MASAKIFHYGQRVTAQGKNGIVRAAGDKYTVKFDDGTFGFFGENEMNAVVEETYLKGKYDRMKAEGALRDGATFMEPTAAGEDPLSQPKRDTGASIGEAQTVLGKSVTNDMFYKEMSAAMQALGPVVGAGRATLAEMAANNGRMAREQKGFFDEDDDPSAALARDKERIATGRAGAAGETIRAAEERRRKETNPEVEKTGAKCPRCGGYHDFPHADCEKKANPPCPTCGKLETEKMSDREPASYQCSQCGAQGFE